MADRFPFCQSLTNGRLLIVIPYIILFECCEDTYAELFERLWKVLESAAPDTFSILDGDLNY